MKQKSKIKQQGDLRISFFMGSGRFCVNNREMTDEGRQIVVDDKSDSRTAQYLLSDSAPYD